MADTNETEKRQPFILKGINSETVDKHDDSQNTTCGNRKCSTEHEVSTDFAVAPDGGYGWVIVLACFILQGMIDGLFSVFGVFFPQFLEYFDSSRGKTAIIGSLLSACMMLLGPFVSVLVGIMGCRKVTIIGGFLITLGLVLSTFAPTIDILIITFGFIGGTGLGFIFQPAVVMVGFWFDKKRAVAMGIASSGAGIGMLVLSSLSGKLLESYDWKNSMIMISCVTLQCIVCGALLRPLRIHEKDMQTSLHEENNETILHNGINEHKSALFKFEEGNTENRSTTGKRHIRTLSSNSYDRVITQNKDKSSLNHLNHIHAIQSQPQYSSLKNLPLQRRHLQGEVYLSHQEISKHKIENIHTLSNPLLKKDIFYSGSIQNIPNKDFSSNTHVKSLSSSVGQGQAPGSIQCCQKDYFTPMKEMLSLHILMDPSFIIIAIANSLMQAGFVICVYFLTDYGIHLGISPEVAALSVSIYGIGTTIGRASAGVIANLPCVKPAYVTSVSLVISGVFSICIVLLCKSFIPLAVCVGLTGLFVAPIIPLTSVMIVDYLGLDHLTNGHGMVSLAKGISSLFSAPIAGFLKDSSGSYTAPFCLTGVLFIIAGLLHLLLPLFRRSI